MQRNVEILRKVRTFVTALNTRDVEGVTALCAPDLTFQRDGETLKGREELVQYQRNLFQAFPDIAFTVDEVLTPAKDAVVLKLGMKGTHLGPLTILGKEIPATGRPVNVPAVITNWQLTPTGEIKALQLFQDRGIIFEQLGANPLQTEKEIHGLAEKYVSALNRHDAATVATCFIENALVTMPGQTPFVGREAIKLGTQNLINAFPDQHIALENIQTEGRKAVLTFAFTGTHKGPGLMVPPTNKPVNFKGVILAEVGVQGFAKAEFIYDEALIRKQIGLMEV